MKKAAHILLFSFLFAVSLFFGDAAWAACAGNYLTGDQKVIVFADADCGAGFRAFSNVGTNNMPNEFDNLASSVQVAEGYTATLFDDAGCTGSVRQDFPAGIHTYVGATLNDKTSCVSIAAPDGLGETIPVEEHAGIEPEPIRLENPLGTTDITQIIGNVIKTIMGILGALTLFVFVDGAWHWITAAGNPERVKKGVKTMMFAVLGLFIIFASYGILNAFFQVLGTTGAR